MADSENYQPSLKGTIMSTIITFIVGANIVMPMWCAVGAILHATGVDQKIAKIWLNASEWKMLPVLVLILIFALPAIGAYSIVKVALDKVFVN